MEMLSNLNMIHVHIACSLDKSQDNQLTLSSILYDVKESYSL